MPKPGSGRPVSRQRGKSRRTQPQHVPGVPGFPVQVTFALREPVRYPFILAGTLLGAAGAIPAQRYLGLTAAVAATSIGVALGILMALLLRETRCVEPGCGAVIGRGVATCPGCGGSVIGHLEAGGAGAEG